MQRVQVWVELSVEVSFVAWIDLGWRSRLGGMGVEQ